MFSLLNDQNQSIALRIERAIAEARNLYNRALATDEHIVEQTLRQLDALDAKIFLWKQIEDIDGQAESPLGPGRLLVFITPGERAYYIVLRECRSHVIARHLPIEPYEHPSAIPHGDGTVIISREAAARAAHRLHAKLAGGLAA
jgi:hypothetical protein